MIGPSKIISPNHLEGLVHQFRGQKVMLDFDLAALYGVETRVLNQAVKRNKKRFPADFLFQLSKEEMAVLAEARTLKGDRNSSQIVMSPPVHRGSTYRFYALTEQGVAMLSSVLRSSRAIQVNIEIMRAFIRLRQWLASNAELTRKLDDLEKKYDKQFKVVFEAIRELMEEKISPKPRREIGFHTIQAVTPKAVKAGAKRI
jgi:hypothetical protein